MKNLWQLLGLSKPTTGDFGIEIECEGKRLRQVNTDLWTTVPDGSLRGDVGNGTAMEWVLAKPIPYNDVGGALNILKKAQEGATFNFSFRTSVHVHLNVQQLTHVQLSNLIYTYVLLEEVFMRMCSEERRGNRFCLRATDAEGMYDILEMVLKYEKGFRDVPHDRFRYSALNLEALNKYGSVEFRGMHGNFDLDLLSKWVKVLYNLRTYAQKVDNPMSIRADFLKWHPYDFATEVMGDVVEELWSDDLMDQINRNFSLAVNLPFSWKQCVYKKEEQPKAAYKVKGVLAGRPDLMAAMQEVNPAAWRGLQAEAREVVARRRVVDLEPAPQGLFVRQQVIIDDPEV